MQTVFDQTMAQLSGISIAVLLTKNGRWEYNLVQGRVVVAAMEHTNQ
jgi:hypothetical protein